jgi:WD40 repeat protein
MTKINAWTFLVSRNQYLDYRTVVAPDFMIEAGCGNLLARAVPGEELTESGQAICREIRNSGVGDLTLVFQVVYKEANEIGLENEGIVADTHSRPILFLEGIVLKGRLAQAIKTHALSIDKNLGEYVNTKIKKPFSVFWSCTDFNTPISSDFFELVGVERSDSLTIQCLETYIVTSESSNKIIIEDFQKKITDIELERDQLINEVKERFPIYSNNREWKSFDINIKIEVSSIAFSPCGNFVACRTNNQKVFVSNLNGDQIHCFHGPASISAIPGSVAFSPDSKLIATTFVNNFGRRIIRRWKWDNTNTSNIVQENDEKDLELEGFTVRQGKEYVKAIFSLDSNLLFCGGLYSSIYICDIKSFSLFKDKLSTQYEVKILSLAISKDSSIIAGGCEDGKIRFWKVKSKTSLRLTNVFIGLTQEEEKHKGKINSVAFSHNAPILASGGDGDDGTVRLWDVSDPKEPKLIRILGHHSSAVNSVAFSSKDPILASGSDDHSIKIWDIENVQGKEPLTLSKEFGGHSSAVNSVAFSPDGQILASGSNDRTVKIWRRIKIP